ncbi:MSC_0623 family F1-like ATPase-associated protein [Mycoplasma sp. 1654_15]|uniref:MSC_0623 family F1-like ATPase-associated protein n=1 Tax=Mycoplasma sp. 1654_15 TaxID=2725994 RepID=UPI001449DAD7|nr:DUF2714 domain-containing protein [Mycoplasma sp. 1654_15]QJB71539.1 DUF2714 domain-containing protein [Mycoplasma sp. 1654_15]
MNKNIKEYFSSFLSFTKKKEQPKLTKIEEKEFLVFDDKTKIEVFDLYKEYQLKREDNNFISFNQLYSSVLLKISAGFSSEVYKNFEKKYQNALKKKTNLDFANFAISFNLDLKYSQNLLVPILIHKGNSNNLVENFVTSTNLVEQRFYTFLNNQVNQYLLENKILELLPGLLIFRSSSSNTSTLRTLFSKDFISILKR